MFALAHLVLQISLFRKGPEDLPASSLLLGLLLVINVLVSITLYSTINDTTVLRAATLVVASLAATAGLVWLVLNLLNYAQRFMQTFTALVGVDVLLTCITAIIAVLTLQEDGAMGSIGSLALLLLLIWNLSIYASIFQRALEVHLIIGLGLALFVVIFSVAIGQVAVSG